MYDREENDIIRLYWRDRSSCTIHLQGGTISSWIVYNREVLFVSKRSNFNYLSPISGGIQTVFPSFKDVDDVDQDFSNLLKWSLISGPVIFPDHCMECEIMLDSDVYTMCRYPYEFRMKMKIRLEEENLLVITKVFNPSHSKDIMFNYALRAYLVAPRKQSYYEGFAGSIYYDYINKKFGVLGECPLKQGKKMEVLCFGRRSPSIQLGHLVHSDIVRIRPLYLPNLLLWNANAINKPCEFFSERDEKCDWICFQPTVMPVLKLNPRCTIKAGIFMTHLMGPERFPTDDKLAWLAMKRQQKVMEKEKKKWAKKLKQKDEMLKMQRRSSVEPQRKESKKASETGTDTEKETARTDVDQSEDNMMGVHVEAESIMPSQE